MLIQHTGLLNYQISTRTQANIPEADIPYATDGHGLKFTVENSHPNGLQETYNSTLINLIASLSQMMIMLS